MLAATEHGLDEIGQRVERGTLHGADQIGLAVGPALKRYRIKKHFELEITDIASATRARPTRSRPRPHSTGSTSYAPAPRDTELSTAEVVRSYKSLEQVERAFRTFKGPELEIRPIDHRLEQRVRAHVFICMLAYYLTWHLRDAWAPLLFKDESPPVHPDPVAKANRSPAASAKPTPNAPAPAIPATATRA